VHVKKSLRKTGRTPITGMAQANFQIPAHLHEAMKAIRQARHQLEGADPKLCRIYREAAEQYVAAEPQQRLLQQASRGQKTLRVAG
jgi:hypothetical protein